MSIQSETQAKNKGAEKKRVLLVDDHPVVRSGFAVAINDEADLFVCAEAPDAKAAIEAIEKNNPDIAIVDLSLQGTSGHDLIRSIRQDYPDLPVLVVSMHDETTHAIRALHNGARGYVMKREDVSVMIEGIRTVLEGEIFVSDNVKTEVMSQMFKNENEKWKSPAETLTPREIEVFELIGHGMSSRKVAEQLGVSVRTVDTHREHIKKKLKLASVVELHHAAFEWVRQ